MCTKCKIEKPATPEYFNVDNSNMDGLNYSCKECTSKYSKKYYQENRERIKERSREYSKEYIKNNMATLHKNRIPPGVPNTLTNEDWLECVNYFDGCDAYTGLKLTEPSIDHVIPFSKGGGHEKKNIVPCDLIINRRKHDKDMEEWYRYYFRHNFSEERLAKIKAWTSQ